MENRLPQYVRSIINNTCSNYYSTEVAQWGTPSYSQPPTTGNGIRDGREWQVSTTVESGTLYRGTNRFSAPISQHIMLPQSTVATALIFNWVVTNLIPCNLSDTL